MDPEDAPLLDTAALQRRVLLTGLVSLGLFVLAAWAVSSVGLPDVALLVVAAALYVVVVRPLMRPVREVVALRRRLAYQAFLEQREEQGRG